MSPQRWKQIAHLANLAAMALAGLAAHYATATTADPAATTGTVALWTGAPTLAAALSFFAGIVSKAKADKSAAPPGPEHPITAPYSGIIGGLIERGQIERAQILLSALNEMTGQPSTRKDATP